MGKTGSACAHEPPRADDRWRICPAAGASGPAMEPQHTRPCRITGTAAGPLYSDDAGTVMHLLPTGSMVQARQIVAELRSPQLDHDRAVSMARLDTLQATLSERMFGVEDTASLDDTREKIEQETAERLRTEAAIRQMTIHAPFPGQLVDVPPEIHAGDTVKQHEYLGTVISPTARPSKPTCMKRISASSIPARGPASLPMILMQRGSWDMCSRFRLHPCLKSMPRNRPRHITVTSRRTGTKQATGCYRRKRSIRSSSCLTGRCPRYPTYKRGGAYPCHGNQLHTADLSQGGCGLHGEAGL